MNYKEEILNYIKAQYKAKDLEEDSNIFSTGVLDSFGIVELIGYLEGKYKVKFNAGDLSVEKLQNVNVIADLIKDKVSA